METFTNDGYRFEVTDRGPAEGEAVVLLHGFPESRNAWDEVIPLLVHAGYRVLAPNQRGYSRGARPRQRRAYTLDKLSGDIVAMLDQAGVTRAHIVGHDWGGGVAWDLAANHAERVLTVTSLATPHPRAMVKAATRGTQGLKSFYMFLFQLPRLPELSFRSGMWRAMERSGLPKRYIESYRALFDEPGAAQGALNWYRALPFGSPNGVGPVAVPTLYIYGTEDVALGRKAADLTGDYVTGPYRYEIFEGISHWIPEEVPTRTAEVLLDFLAS
jgi:pimeloyl-ACP methyl ester carboxylesterase